MRRPILFASLLLGLLLIGFFFFRGDSGPDSNEYYQVKRGDFLVSITEGGTLTAVKESVVRNELEGSSRIIYIIPEGTYVKEGDLLVELDAGEAEDELNEQQIAYEKSLAAHIAAQNDLVIMKSTVDSEVSAADLAVVFAKMDLSKFAEVDKGQQQRLAEIDIIAAKESLKIAEEKLEWSKKLAQKGFETKSNLDRDNLAVTNGSLTLEKAEGVQRMLKEYDLAKLEAEFKSTLEEAKKELLRVGKQGESKIAQAEADMRSAKATLDLNKAKLDKMTEQLTATKLSAPIDGLVVYAAGNSRYSSESMVEEGAQVRQRQELIKIPDVSEMKVEIKVHESHIGQVVVGQTAYVMLDSLPDQRFRGEVVKVALLPDSQSRWSNPNLKVYSTEIVVRDELPDVKPGVSARAEIVVTNLKDVVTVPIQAVTTVKGQQICYAKGLAGPKRVSVKVGLFNNKFIEIVKGLDQGDQVLLAPPLDPDEDLSGEVIGDTEGMDLPSERPEKKERAGASGGGRPEGAQGGRPEGAGGRSSGGGEERAGRQGGAKLPAGAGEKGGRGKGSGGGGRPQ